ncbi:hypothetical protein ACIPWL_17035 [Streptomyces sp. NPDC090023]|uniref:hypothetical protein n=1 Tax=unclassified Streptomyces TaxID=2593676 RepID=UPI0038121DA0
MRKLGDLLPRLDPTRPLLDQFTRAAETQRDDPRLAALRGSVTSEPGRSTALLRRLLYSQLQLPEPPHPAATRAIPVPSIPAEDSRRLPHLPAMAVTAEVGEREATVFVRRYPGALQGGRQGHLTGAHLTADPDDPDPRWPRSADVLVLPRERCPRSEAVKWSDFAARYPACGLVAVEESDRGCTLLFPDETRVRARWIERPAWASFAIAASALHAWTEPVRERLRIEVRAGDDPAPALLEVDPAP